MFYLGIEFKSLKLVFKNLMFGFKNLVFGFKKGADVSFLVRALRNLRGAFLLLRS